jgi:uncharacterized integral membrane protein
MPLNPEMRASDADRDRVAAALREHCAEGRITMDELQERLEATYTAKTQGALQEVTADLPETDLYALPVPAAQRARLTPARQRAVEHYRTGMRANWAVYASVNLICFTIWLITSVTSAELIYPWWIWVAGPWGAVLLAGALFGPKGRRDG